MLRFILLLLASLNLSQGFNSKGWLSRFCVENGELGIIDGRGLVCEDFNFTKQELDDIQQKEFVISEERTILFFNGDIGTLNEQFIKKFPKAENIILMGVKMELEPSLHSMKHPVESMVLSYCHISNIRNSEFFQNLFNMKSLELSSCEFDYTVLEKKLFGPDSQLKNLIINHLNMKINPDAFEGLRNLEHLNFNGNLEDLPPNLLSKLIKLKSLNLGWNKLQKVPCNAIPENVEEISLFRNRIHKPSFEGCMFVKSLKKLYLGENGIESIDESVFDSLRNLEELYLDYNQIGNISNAQFKNLAKLKKIDLKGNVIKSTDIRSDIVVEL